MKKFISLLVLAFSCGCATVNYNILTGKENLTFISEKKEIQLGKKISKQVADDFQIIKDPALRDKVNSIGYKLVENCDRKNIIYYFEVIEKIDTNTTAANEKEEPNAFALPGGYIYINKKLIEMLNNNDAEIAAVLAHEISHTVLRHNILMLQEALGAQALMIILATNSADSNSAKNSQIALILLYLEYSKEREMEADKLALKYLKLSGFNPRSAITVLEKIKNYQFDSPIRSYYMKTHPYLDERIEVIERELATNIR